METLMLWKTVPGRCEEVPVLEYYPAENKCCDTAVVIFPGGGYWTRAEHEGKGYAQFLNTLGIDAFVCQYRIAPHEFPLPLLDARRAVQYVRKNADKYGINPDRIGVMGSSAGGHLAATVSTLFEEYNDFILEKDEIDFVDFIPNFQILCYPVIALNGFGHFGCRKSLLGERIDDEELTEHLCAQNNVSEKTPKAFIWHTFDDTCVNVKNSLAYAVALKDNSIDCELHIFQNGNHGLGLALNNESVGQWSKQLEVWFRHNGLLGEKNEI